MKRSEALKKYESFMGLNNLSHKTRRQYCNWLNRYFNFIEENDAIKKLSSKDKFNEFISNIVNQNPQPSLSNQKQAFFAILYFYRNVLELKMEGLNPPSGRRSQKIFNVLTSAQISKLITSLPPEFQLIARLLYGTGARIDECLSLRIKDIDFEHNLIHIQEGKGDKARSVDLPLTVIDELKSQIESAKVLYEFDRDAGKSGVYIPHMLDKKNPNLGKSFEWFWVFPNRNHGKDPNTGTIRRHHVYDFTLQAAFREARRKAKLPIYTTPHILRHCYATHYLVAVLRDLPQIPNIDKFARDLLRQKMGHVDANTTDIYIHLATPKNKILNYSPLENM